MEVSVIVPVYNAEKMVHKCIESLLNQNIEKEIILIDNNSTDESVNIIKEFYNKHKEIIFLSEKYPGAAAARNRGLDYAKGKYIAFIDSDVVLPNSKWITCAISLLEENYHRNIVGVGGVGLSYEKNTCSKALDALLYGVTKEDNLLVKNLATMDLVMKREDIGNLRFNLSLQRAQDPEFCFNFADNGKVFLLSSTLWVFHMHPITLKEIILRWFKYGLYYRFPYKLHPHQKNKLYYFRILIPFLFILMTFLSFINMKLIFVNLGVIISIFIRYCFKFYSRYSLKIILQYSYIHSIKQLSLLTGIYLSYFGVKLRRGKN